MQSVHDGVMRPFATKDLAEPKHDRPPLEPLGGKGEIGDDPGGDLHQLEQKGRGSPAEHFLAVGQVDALGLAAVAARDEQVHNIAFREKLAESSGLYRQPRFGNRAQGQKIRLRPQTYKAAPAAPSGLAAGLALCNHAKSSGGSVLTIGVISTTIPGVAP